MNQKTTIKKSDGLSKKTQTNEKCLIGKIGWDKNKKFIEGNITYSDGSKWNYNNGVMKRIIKSK